MQLFILKGSRRLLRAGFYFAGSPVSSSPTSSANFDPVLSLSTLAILHALGSHSHIFLYIQPISYHSQIQGASFCHFECEC